MTDDTRVTSDTREGDERGLERGRTPRPIIPPPPEKPAEEPPVTPPPPAKEDKD